MTDMPAEALPPSIERVLRLFRSMGREEKMQALVQYSKKLEPFPERFSELDRGEFHLYRNARPAWTSFPRSWMGRCISTDLNARQSPTIAAVLAIVFGAVNDQPPSTTLAIPSDFVRTLMESIGLGTREPGLNAMIRRLKRYAAEAVTTTT